jgi:hypothetical protein
MVGKIKRRIKMTIMKMDLKQLAFLLAMVVVVSCTKTKGFGPLTDTVPAIPVTIANAVDYRPSPTVKASKADGKIQIVLKIPENSGRTIKEITRVSANTVYTGVQTTSGLYNAAPIPGNGNTATFNTTLTEYTSKAAGTIPASNTELAKRFYFLITLDNNETITTSDVRVLVVD